jgi:lipoprotein-releasing system ATP-binding protein
MDEPVLEARGLSRTYRDGDLTVEVLRQVDFVLPPASQIAIVGASGSGKSTLLNLLGGLDQPSGGSVLVQGQNLAQLGESQLCQMRNRHLGFVYQFHHLLPEFSALENVAMPGMIAGQDAKTAEAAAAELLEIIGLSSRLSHRPSQLSGGERQRVAIARALVMKPNCVLMDEPTGNLDPAAAEQVLQLIAELRANTTASFVVVTHDQAIAARMDARYELREGQLDPLP